MKQIKDCPFCGGNARIMRKQTRFIQQFEDGQKEIKMSVYVACNKCHSRGMPITYRKCGLYRYEFEDDLFDEMAIENWNKRIKE